MSNFIVPVLFVLASIGLFFGYIDAAYEKVEELQVQDAEFSRALDQAKELEEIRNQLNNKYNTFSSEDLTRLKKLLPDNIDNVRLILDIDHLASTHNIKVQNLVLDENENDVAIGSPGRLYESAKMNFSVEAPYKVFMAFLEDLEASLRIIDAADLSFTSNQIDQYSYNVSIRTYWLR